MSTRSHDKASHVDFDIGHFVSSFDALKEQLNDFRAILCATDSLRRWEVPSLTLLFCVFVVTLCVAFPELLLVFGLSPIPLALLVTYIKNVGQKKAKQVNHIVVMAVESEEEKLKRKQQQAQKAKTDLRRFIKILCELQQWMEETRKRLDFIESLFSWKDPQLTLRFLGYIFISILSLILVPMSFIILTGFLVAFLHNENFKRVFFEHLAAAKIYETNKSTLTESDKECHSVEWFDAPDMIDTDSSSYEEESDDSESETMEETMDHYVRHKARLMVNQNSGKRSRSFVSHISAYRRRRQEFNKGKCAACDVAFSSLLTRRRYCRRCGDKFCSKCCRLYVTKAALGATAPGSRDQRVLVCSDCYGILRATKTPD